MLIRPNSPSRAAAYAYQFQPIAGGFKSPVSVIQPPDGSNRLFVVELPGLIHIVKAGAVLAKPFLDLTAITSTRIFGQGLYNLAFDPNYARNGLVYVLYVNNDGNPVLARYSVSATNPDLADPSSAKTILIIPHPHGFHYGGQLAFGPDGYLYYSTGDGGSPLDSEGNAQNKSSLLGALLRLDVAHGDPYAIPPDNPYVHDSAARPELWAKGLRNPWRFSFDSLTGDLYIPDVGEDVYEEINFQPAGDKGGENYGWNRYEGTHDIIGGSKAGLTFPVIEYTHIDHNCAVVGGYVYRGTALPNLAGSYIFGDYCSGKIWMLTHPNGQWTMTLILQVDMNIEGFGQDSNGELYISDFRTNSIYRLVSAP
jgi:glucose/arabinose dehydrogenase